MVNYTDYQGFQLWQDDEEPWEHRTDFQKLDTLVVDHGTKSNRPSSAPDGAMYLATDENVLYQYNSGTSSWDTRLGGNDGTAGLQATNTDLSTVTGNTVGVSRATDDGTNTPSGHAELCLWVDRSGNGDTAWQIIGTETYIEVA